MGRMVEEFEARTSGHIETIRRNFMEVKFIKVNKSIVSLILVREAEKMIARWCSAMKKMPMPIFLDEVCRLSFWWGRGG